MKKFLVIRDFYTRDGCGGLGADIHSVLDLKALLIELMDLQEYNDAEIISEFGGKIGDDVLKILKESFEQSNGDGQDYCLVYEMFDDGLVVVLGEEGG